MKRFFSIITNKYMLALLIFLVMMLFISPYDYFTIRESKKELQSINDKIEFLNKESDSINKELSILQTDSVVLEKYAREMYFEKKDGEDVYLVK